MEARAILRYARISPRKVSIVMDLIRNKPLDEALAILQYTPKAACEPLLKLVNSAAANAENNFQMDRNNLYVAECYVCPGPTLKRIMPRDHGRAYRILKRTSHMTVVLKEKEKGGKQMGQKVNPHGMRVGVIKDWDSRWFTSKQEFGDTLVEDYKIRKTLKKQLYAAGVPKIEIERTVDSQSGAPRIKVSVFCSKPGIVIGKGGAESTKLEAQLAKMTGKNVNLNIVEVKGVTTNAQLVAEDVASQLERRIAFRRAMKQVIRNAMQPRNGVPAKGIKVTCSGRLAGADIARTESYHEGTIPLQTLRADIDYGFAEANTTYGKVGVKVWIYKGEILKGAKPAAKKEGGKQ